MCSWDAVIAPDWVCETVSASTRRLDLHEKRPIYAREGISHLWLVDPTDPALEAFGRREGQWVLIATAKDDEPVSIRPFDAITFSLGDLWPCSGRPPAIPAGRGRRPDNRAASREARGSCGQR